MSSGSPLLFLGVFGDQVNELKPAPDTDHFIPKNEYIKETLRWLDRYLGPVK